MQLSLTILKKGLALGLWGGLLAVASAQGLRMPGESPTSSLRSDAAPASQVAPAPVPAPQARPESRSRVAPAQQAAPEPAAAPRARSTPRSRVAPAPQPAPAPLGATNRQAEPAVAKPAVGTGTGTVDGIVAVVNNDVITRRELDERVAMARTSLQQQGIQAPPQDVLDHQVLERMIIDKAQLQEADRAGIRISDQQLDASIARIAEQNGLNLAQLREQVQKDGLTWDAYRAELRDQIRMNRLREIEVDRNIIISEAEVDAFLAEQGNQQQANPRAAAASGGALHLAQILVRVPEGSSPSEIATLRSKAENLLQQVRGGADFAQLAAAASDGEEALRGGDLGVRPTVGWPDLFVQAVNGLQAGQSSELVQSGNGFHILHVVAREGGASPVMQPLGSAGPQSVTQNHVRHILIRTSAVMSDDQARSRLESLRNRITQGGVSFADMARQYSDDASAPQGGEIGWVSPGDTVPPFERAMNALQPGQISEPVHTQFGWHLILVEDRRVEDVSDEARRVQARQILYQRKLEPAWAEWLSVVRSRAYVDNRLDRTLD